MTELRPYKRGGKLRWPDGRELAIEDYFASGVWEFLFVGDSLAEELEGAVYSDDDHGSECRKHAD